MVGRSFFLLSFFLPSLIIHALRPVSIKYEFDQNQLLWPRKKRFTLHGLERLRSAGDDAVMLSLVWVNTLSFMFMSQSIILEIVCKAVVQARE